MSLRIKLTLSFLLISLATAATVGGLAYGRVMWDFRQSVEDQSFKHFKVDMTAYINAYGSWNRAVQSEPFPEFVRRRHRSLNQLQRPQDHAGIIPTHNGRAPFRFLLIGTDGRVLLPAGHFEPGQQVPSTLLHKAHPIKVNGKVEVLAFPVGDPIMSQEDRAYLSLIRRALVTGVIAAGILSILTGLLLSRRMSAALGELTAAVRRIQPGGELRLKIPVHSQDEVGTLATALNLMSAKLAKAQQTVKLQSDELLQLSIRDPLTDLYNRRYFDEQVEQLFRQATRYKRPLTLVILDLDHFKQINDRHSHAVGDEVLRQVAKLLKDSMRASDVIARYGGEEFVIACAESNLQQTSQRCNDLRQRIEDRPWHDIAPDLKVTASMGLSDSVSLDSVQKMLEEADARLYQAKEAGRNRIMPETMMSKVQLS